MVYKFLDKKSASLTGKSVLGSDIVNSNNSNNNNNNSNNNNNIVIIIIIVIITIIIINKINILWTWLRYN